MYVVNLDVANKTDCFDKQSKKNKLSLPLSHHGFRIDLPLFLSDRTRRTRRRLQKERRGVEAKRGISVCFRSGEKHACACKITAGFCRHRADLVDSQILFVYAKPDPAPRVKYSNCRLKVLRRHAGLRCRETHVLRRRINYYKNRAVECFFIHQFQHLL